ncbi:MAG: DUF58 domain-containing protein [Candidatus Melainabacteria bacterium]|nr:DUF58 domain-containing protein [Candidatus Melainabacteria bacterium]
MINDNPVLDKVLISQIKKILLKSDKLSSQILAGEYKSAFKGTGLNFESIREYQHGDEIKNLDWKVTARMQGPYIRQYKEERQMTLLLVIDLSASSLFGTEEKTKQEITIELASILAFLAIKNNDKVGLMIVSEDVEFYLEPKQGKAHIFRLIKELLTFKPLHKTTNIKKTLSSVIRLSPKHSIIFYISDFLDNINQIYASEKSLINNPEQLNYSHEIKILKKTQDLSLVSIRDPKELSLPNLGFIEICDPETGHSSLLNLNRKVNREYINKLQSNHREVFKAEIKKLGIKFLELSTDKNYLIELQKFFLKK